MEATDNTGNEILEVIAKASKFNYWMYTTIKPYLKGNILEIGSGIGNISTYLLADNASITLSDTDPYYTNILQEKFSRYNNLKNILQIDILDTNFEITYAAYKDSFDTVFLLNVLEHIADDKKAVKNCKYLLKPAGKLVILTPAYKFLYSSLDKALGHYRRYTIGRIKKLFDENNLKVEKSFYFNALGIVAWLYGKIFRLKTIPAGEMGFYNRLTGLAKIIDKISFKKTGLSVIAIGEKI